MSTPLNVEVIDITEDLEAALAPEDPPAKVIPNKPAAKKAPAKKAPAKAPAKKAPGKAVAKAPAKVTVIEGELPLDKAQAEKLDKKIVTAVERVGTAADTFEDRMDTLTELVNEARAGQIHVGLGFASWTAYFTKRVQTPVLAIGERKPVVALLHDETSRTQLLYGDPCRSTSPPSSR